MWIGYKLYINKENYENVEVAPTQEPLGGKLPTEGLKTNTNYLTKGKMTRSFEHFAPIENPKGGFFMDFYKDQLCCLLLDCENSFIFFASRVSNSSEQSAYVCCSICFIKWSSGTYE
jgi:hypothetical protein